MCYKEVSSLPASRTRTPSPTATMRIHQVVVGVPNNNNNTVVVGPSHHRLSTPPFAPHSSYHPFSCPHLDFALEKASYYRRDRLLKSSARNVTAAGDDGSSVPEEVGMGVRHRDDVRTLSSSGDDVFGDDDEMVAKADGYVRFSRTDVSANELDLPGGSVDGQRLSKDDLSRQIDEESSSSPHNYEYPSIVPQATSEWPPPNRHTSVTSSSSPAAAVIVDPIMLPRRKDRKRRRGRRPDPHSRSGSSGGMGGGVRARCVYCQELFVVAENHRGACPDAPDDCAACVERATCLCAARALLYHCATDDDGSYGPVCGGIGEPTVSTKTQSTGDRRRRRRKWILLCLLSIVLPCLCCYPALAACHSCAVRRGHCGARHQTT